MPTTIRSLPVAIALGVVLLTIVACSSGSTGAVWTYAPLPTGTPAPSGSASSSPSTSPSGSVEPSPSASASVEPSPSASACNPCASVEPTASTVPSIEPSPTASAAGDVIELLETISLQITQNGARVGNLAVKSGETYTFRITNQGGLEHNFYIGPADRIEAGDVEGLPGVPISDSGTQEFEYTVTDETATLAFGCSIPGHFGSMNGTFTVEP
ncbi:MAG: hypothetical protein ABIZ34_01150 [Candidatus Limnocylindrales bacterium]